jgi:hypothetical protein
VSSERLVQRMVDADLRAQGGGCAKRIAPATGQTPTVDRVRKRVLLPTSWASARRAIRCRSSVSPARSSVAYAGVAQARTDRGLTSGAGQNQWSGGRRRGECSPAQGKGQWRSRRSSAYWPATGGSPASGPAARSGGRRGPRPGWSVGRHPRAPDAVIDRRPTRAFVRRSDGVLIGGEAIPSRVSMTAASSAAGGGNSARRWPRRPLRARARSPERKRNKYGWSIDRSHRVTQPRLTHVPSPIDRCRFRGRRVLGLRPRA